MGEGVLALIVSACLVSRFARCVQFVSACNVLCVCVRVLSPLLSYSVWYVLSCLARCITLSRHRLLGRYIMIFNVA